MFNNFKYNLMHGWSIMRAFRVILGIIALTQAILTLELLIGLAGIILLIQAIFNVGCCGTSGCFTKPFSKNSSVKDELIHYEEIK